MNIKWFNVKYLTCCKYNNIILSSFKSWCQPSVNLRDPGTLFMPPAWKVLRGHLEFGSSVHPSVCPFVRNSVPLINKVQYLKFGWSYSNQTYTLSSSKGCSHFTDITCPWGWGGVKNVGLRDFCHSLTLLLPGASVFHRYKSTKY